MHRPVLSSAAQKSSFAESVATATPKIMSVRFGPGPSALPWALAPFFTFPLIIDPAAHPDVLSHTQHHTEKREAAEWWREGHLQILPQPAPSPCGAEHLTFNYDSRKQTTGMPSTFILPGAVFFSLAGRVSSLCNYAQWQFTPRTGCFLNPTVQGGGSLLQPKAKCKEWAARKFSLDLMILNL